MKKNNNMKPSNGYKSVEDELIHLREEVYNKYNKKIDKTIKISK